MPIVLKSVSLNILEPSGSLQACNGISLPSSSSVHLVTAVPFHSCIPGAVGHFLITACCSYQPRTSCVVKGPGLESSNISMVSKFKVTHSFISACICFFIHGGFCSRSASGVEGHTSRASGHHGFKFGTVARKICRASIWILIHATLLALGILMRLLDFWKIIVRLLCDVGVRSVV